MRRLSWRSIALSLVASAVLMVAPLAAAASVFSGKWYAHDASLRITRGGVATERIWAYVFCATSKGPGPVDYLTMRFRLSALKKRQGVWTARDRVTRTRNNCRLDTAHRRLHVGELGQIRLRHGVIREALSGLHYCDPAEARKGACGA